MRKSYVQLAIGLFISGLFLYWVLRPVDFPLLGRALAQYQWWWAVPFLLLNAASLWLRAMRWRILLLPTRSLTSARLFSPLMAGFALNSLLPARAGEFARAVILNRTEKLPLAPAFATIVVERLFDMITLLGLLSLVVLNIRIDPALSYPYSTRWTMPRETFALALIIAGILIPLLTVLIGLAARTRPIARWMRAVLLIAVLSGFLMIFAGALAGYWMPPTLSGGGDFVINGETLTRLGKQLGFLCLVALVGSAAFLVPMTRHWIVQFITRVPYAPKVLRLKIGALAESFAQGLDSLRSPRAIASVMAYSVALWLIVGMSFQVAALGFPGMKIGFFEGQAVNVITCLAILIPAAPGFWGLMEVGIVFSLNILSVESDPSKALAFALLVHAMQYFPILSYGLYCLWGEKKRMGGEGLLVAVDSSEASKA